MRLATTGLACWSQHQEDNGMRKNPKLHPRDTKLAFISHPRRDPIGGAVLGLSFAPDVVSGWLLAIGY